MLLLCSCASFVFTDRYSSRIHLPAKSGSDWSYVLHDALASKELFAGIASFAGSDTTRLCPRSLREINTQIDCTKTRTVCFTSFRSPSPTATMKLLSLGLLVACAASTAGAAKPNLPSDAPLRIGIKHRVPEEECTRKSKPGDRLSMHYTGTLREDDSQFDSSIGRGPFDFVIGVRHIFCRVNTCARMLVF